MSYLPRMSKTYKEPREEEEEEPKESNQAKGLEPASSLVNEKSHNPELVLKHYKYYPHPPPVLPGPSVADEANESELFREASKLRRSLSKCDNIPSSLVLFEDTTPELSQKSLEKIQPTESSESQPTQTQLKKQSSQKGSKMSMSKKKSSKSILDKKKDNSKQFVNPCLVEMEFPETLISQIERNYDLLSPSELKNLRREKTSLTTNYCNILKSPRYPEKKVTRQKSRENRSSKLESIETIHRSVQCAIFGNPDRETVIPSAIITLLKALAFLLHEINKYEILSCNSTEGKRIMNQIQLILGDLCNQNVNGEFSFDVSYSDSKRVEKVVDELKKYIKNNYGDEGEFVDKAKELREIFIQLKLKELELGLLKDRLQERESLQLTEVEVRASDMKNPELTLQNKRLESEQLAAEVEFSRMELSKYQKSLATADWDIKMISEQLHNLKKSSSSKAKTDIVGKKPSVLSGEFSAKGNSVKEISEHKIKKKT